MDGYKWMYWCIWCTYNSLEIHLNPFDVYRIYWEKSLNMSRIIWSHPFVAISSSIPVPGRHFWSHHVGPSTASSVVAVSSAWTITAPGWIDASDWRTKGQALWISAPGEIPRLQGAGRQTGHNRSITVIFLHIFLHNFASLGWTGWGFIMYKHV